MRNLQQTRAELAEQELAEDCYPLRDAGWRKLQDGTVPVSLEQRRARRAHVKNGRVAAHGASLSTRSPAGSCREATLPARFMVQLPSSAAKRCNLGWAFELVGRGRLRDLEVAEFAIIIGPFQLKVVLIAHVEGADEGDRNSQT